MTHSDKTFTSVLSIGGCGTHLLIDFFKASPTRYFDSRLVDFWVTYVQAQHDPHAPTRSTIFGGLSALDAVKGFYGQYGMDWGDDPLNDARAMTLFGRILNQAGPKLASAHNYPLIAPTLSTRVNGRRLFWSSELRDRARALFERAVTAAGYRLEILILIRHPIDVFLSAHERTGDFESEDVTLENTKAFFRMAKGYRYRPNASLVRYEDLCRGEPAAAIALSRIASVAVQDIDLSLFANGEIAKYRRYPRRRVAAIEQQLSELIAEFKYRSEIPSPLHNFFLMIYHSFRRWRGEIRALDRIFAGDLRTPNAIFRRRRSVIGRFYWQLSMLLPGRRRNYRRAYESIHPTPMPTPRFERPIRRLLGLEIVE